MYNKERKFVLFVKKLIYKYIILNCYVQTKDYCMFLDIPVLVLIAWAIYTCV